MRWLARWAFGLGLIGALTSPAMADGRFIETYGVSAANPAAREACPRLELVCSYQQVAEPLSEAGIRRAMRAVQAEVLAQIGQVTDERHWGVVDRWDLPEDGWGDCEDHALEKMRRLLARGVPHERLRIAAADVPDPVTGVVAGHAVLIVTTDRGDMVLDNMFLTGPRSRPYAWSRLRGRLFWIQDAWQRGVWRHVRDGGSRR